MRLIDADALEPDAGWCEYHRCFNAYSQMQIAMMPTVEAEPAKHGRWIRSRRFICKLYLTCSECFVAYDFDKIQGLTQMHENVPRYCANCGAKMDGGAV